MPEQSVADIEKQYDTAIEKAKGKPEVLAQLQIERATAVAEAKLRDVAVREQALWRREALMAWPLAEEFADMVVGDTESAVAESAKALHERLLGRFEKHQRKLEIDRIVEQHLNGGKPPEANGDAEPTA